jgi:hypothetical protein
MIGGALLVMDHELLGDLMDSLIQKVCALITHQHFRAPKSGNHILIDESHNHFCNTILDMHCFEPSGQILCGCDDVAHTCLVHRGTDRSYEVDAPLFERIQCCNWK